MQTVKKTQTDWAYGRSAFKVWQKENGEWWSKCTDGWYTTPKVVWERPLDPKYAPRIWDNVPLSGFKLVNTVSRERGNKLFRVMDPRGVEFEITVKSLFRILSEGTVSNGIIMNECVWAKNKDLVIVKKENSE